MTHTHKEMNAFVPYLPQRRKRIALARTRCLRWGYIYAIGIVGWMERRGVEWARRNKHMRHVSKTRVAQIFFGWVMHQRRRIPRQTHTVPRLARLPQRVNPIFLGKILRGKEVVRRQKSRAIVFVQETRRTHHKQQTTNNKK